ncbi:chemotaxis protein [Achromobacter xylosoxidans]|uniref:methyl-accepting chemotaxis protein n=1 Tax=Alcaligenes xylosoxydans xylosoxydans TaxID=85698 RepID=UPI001231A600|nr:methyl-accepting chemotaxis protein [Achromobacter xylosoxidans]KAA5926331.1 chemotaxis protein [Achromobacter xylosoxidans]
MRTASRLLQDSYRRTDRAMLPLLWLLFIVGLCMAPQYGRWAAALIVGGLAAGIPSLLILWLPGRLATRLAVACGMMVLAALHIHLMSGMTEIHFGIFVLLSLLLAYRDWRTILCAALVIAVHHLSFNFLQQWGYGTICFTEPSLGMVLLHATYVVVQAAALGWLAWKMERAGVAAEELARLSAHIGREAGVFDLRFDGQGMHSDLGRSFKTTMDAVHRTMSEVRATATSLSVALSEMMQGNQQLDAHAGTQAESLARTAASMRDLAANVHDNAARAQQARQLTDQARQTVDAGSAAVAGVATMMGEIQQESKKISEIIGLIDSIAFQTNILALNAAVEAARAGESGRGFAVVATEVRALAQRSASAARDIRTLIEGSLHKTSEGFRQADHAAGVIREVVSSIDQAARIVGQIGEAGQTQSADIDAVNLAVSNMDELVRETASEVAQAARASTAQQSQAAALLRAVEVFRLQADPSADAVAAPGARPPSAALTLAGA